MRYIDVIINELTENLLAVDLRFKVTVDTLIKLTGNKNKNLVGVDNLQGAMDVLDSFSGGDSVDGRVTIIDGEGLETPDVTRIVFDEVVVTGVNEVTVQTGSVDENTVDAVVNSINDRLVIYEGVSSLEHIFVHTLDSEFFKFSIWVEETIGWQNSIVPITIVDNNTVKVELSQARPVRIILENINDVSKTYGL